MTMIGGLDVHRTQITYEWVDRDTGQGDRGRAGRPGGSAARSATLSLAGDEQPVSVLEADVLAIASLTIPWTQLGLAGLLSGLLPARRAVRLNLFNALRTA